MSERFQTIPTAARRWHCSEARIRQWISQHRIQGAEKIGQAWVIPPDAKRPTARPPGRPRKKGLRRKNR